MRADTLGRSVDVFQHVIFLACVVQNGALHLHQSACRFRDIQKARPDGGGAMRNAQNIAAFSMLGPVDVLSIGDAEENEEAAGIALWQHFVRQPPPPMPRGAWLMRSGYHPLVDSYAHPEAEAWLTQRLREMRYDVAVVEEISLAGYIAGLRKGNVPVIFDAHNVEAQLRVDLSSNGGL